MFADVPEMPCILVTVCHSIVRFTSRGEFIVLAWADRGGGGGMGPDPHFCGHNIGILTLGPKLDPLLDPLFLLV